MDTYLFQTIACGVLGTGAGVLGFIFLGPAGAGVGLVVGYGCAGSATVGASKKLAACYKADDLCRHPTSNVSHFDDEVYNIVYTAAAWQEVYSPLFYEAPDGHIYWY